MANTEEQDHGRGPDPGASAGTATTTGTTTDLGAGTGTTTGANAGRAAVDGAAGPGTAPGQPARGPGGKFLPKSPDAGPGARKRKRGRPAKSAAAGDSAAKSAKPKTEKLVVALDAATLARVLGFAHSTAALVLKLPALALSDAEAKKLADAICELAALYDIAISARLMAWLQLLAVSAAIYGPRAVAIAATRKAQRPAAAATAASSAAGAGAPKMDFSADAP